MSNPMPSPEAGTAADAVNGDTNAVVSTLSTVSSTSTGHHEVNTIAANVLTLTLDLGTDTGWTLMRGSVIAGSGTLHLASGEELELQRKVGNERAFDIRFSRLVEFITGKLTEGVDRIVFEDVQFIKSQCQSQLWATLRTAIWAAVQQHRVMLRCVSVPTLKFFATGSGNADKLQMAKALAQAEPTIYGFDPAAAELTRNGSTLDDNEVDAIWLARFTAAVDRGEQSFLSIQHRKANQKQERRARRLAAKAAIKARKQLKKQEERSRKEAIRSAIRAAGRCCGVYRRAGSRGLAACPKCGVVVKLASASRAPIQGTENQTLA